MKTLLLPLLFLTFALTARAADPTTGDFTGHYEGGQAQSTGRHGKWSFSLDIEQKGKSATLSFGAASEDGAVAPDGSGEGTLNGRGELKFKWEDSFENAGTAILICEGKRYHLSMKTIKFGMPLRGLDYGDVTLKRTSTKPQTSTR